MNTCIDLMQQNLKTSPQKGYFSPDELAQLQDAAIPRHIAIIPDGNRRWASQMETSKANGHQEGGNTLINIVKAARELGVKVVTFYLFSTENWHRPQDEINALMWLLYNFLHEERQTMLDYGIKCCTIGDLSALPEYVQQALAETKTASADCCDIEMVMALNYGGRDEICRAIHSIVDAYESKTLAKAQIDESLVSSYLDTAPWGDPDLLIRTSGEMRISNYLLWQISYTEIYISSVLWPSFKPQHLLEAILNYQQRHRRLGRS